MLRLTSTGTARRLGPAVIAVAVVVLLAPLAIATPQDDEEARRLRQLEVFEQLLTETVQRYVTIHIDRAIEVETTTLGPDGEEIPGEALVVKTAGSPPAHGLYIADYGVIFSIQTPQVVVLPTAMNARFEAPIATGYNLRVLADDEAPTRSARRVIEFRANMIQESLAELEYLLEQERAGEADPERTAAMIADMERLRANLEELQTKAKTEAAESEALLVIEAEEGEAPDVELERTPDEDGNIRRQVRVDAPRERARARNVFEFYRGMVQQQRKMGDVLERNREELTAAVNEAAIEALAQYGSVIKGLDGDERISVLILPPSPWGPTQLHHDSSEEHILSVRYKDIRDFDNAKIDLAKFRERVTIHTRLGTQVVLRDKDDG